MILWTMNCIKSLKILPSIYLILLFLLSISMSSKMLGFFTSFISWNWFFRNFLYFNLLLFKFFLQHYSLSRNQSKMIHKMFISSYFETISRWISVYFRKVHQCPTFWHFWRIFNFWSLLFWRKVKNNLIFSKATCIKTFSIFIAKWSIRSIISFDEIFWSIWVANRNSILLVLNKIRNSLKKLILILKFRSWIFSLPISDWIMSQFRKASLLIYIFSSIIILLDLC